MRNAGEIYRKCMLFSVVFRECYLSTYMFEYCFGLRSRTRPALEQMIKEAETDTT